MSSPSSPSMLIYPFFHLSVAIFAGAPYCYCYRFHSWVCFHFPPMGYFHDADLPCPTSHSPISTFTRVHGIVLLLSFEEREDWLGRLLRELAGYCAVDFLYVRENCSLFLFGMFPFLLFSSLFVFRQ